MGSALLCFVLVSLISLSFANQGISNYLQGTDGKFAQIGVVSFDATTGVLSLGDKDMGAITEVTSFNGEAKTSDGTTLVLFGSGFTYSGTVDFEPATLTVVQVHDESTTQAQDTLLVINEAIMRYIIVSQRSPAEALAFQTAQNLLKLRDSGKPLKYVRVYQNAAGGWVVGPVFDRFALSSSSHVDDTLIASLTTQSVQVGRTGDLTVAPVIAANTPATTVANAKAFLELNSEITRVSKLNSDLLGYRERREWDDDDVDVDASTASASTAEASTAGGGGGGGTGATGVTGGPTGESTGVGATGVESTGASESSSTSSEVTSTASSSSSTGDAGVPQPEIIVFLAFPDEKDPQPAQEDALEGASSSSSSSTSADPNDPNSSASSSSSTDKTTTTTTTATPDANGSANKDSSSSSTDNTQQQSASATKFIQLHQKLKMKQKQHLAKIQTALDLSSDADEDETRHHHKKHHHKHSHNSDRFSAHKRQRHLFGIGKPPLCGGANMGRDSAGDRGGTMGGLLIAPTASGSIMGGYRIFGMTNFHVMSGGTDSITPQACQPSRWNRKMDTGAATETCESLGQAISSCCSPTELSAATVGKLMDVSIVEIDPTRYNTMCSVYRSVPDVASPTVVLTDVTGSTRANHSDVVTKYGGRTHQTTGKITMIVGDSEGRELKITSTQFPQFTDGTPLTVTAGGFDQISPTNEANFFEVVYKNTLISRIESLPDPRSTTSATYNHTDAVEIWDQLWSTGRVLGAFSAAGDSGSWIMKGSKVVGIMNAGDWFEDVSGGTVTIKGSSWGKFIDETYAYDFATALNFINAQISSDPTLPGLQLQLCTEAARPKPTPADCSTALNGAACNWPRSCQFSGNGTASCAPWGPLGI